MEAKENVPCGNGQMPIFGPKSTKLAGKAYKSPNAYFGPNLVVFGPKFLILTGGSKSFSAHITENHLGTLFASFFGRPRDQIGQECQYLAKNVSFGPNLAAFWLKILIVMGVSKSFGTHITEKPHRQLACIVFWSGMEPNGPKCKCN